MKNYKKTEIKVGLTVLIGLLIFLWILGWAKNFSSFADRKILKMEFDNAAGLAAGDPVMVNGVRKGNVANVEVKGGDVLVTAELEKDVTLKKDARFSIMMLDLMGGKKVEIFPGISDEPIDFSKIQNGKFVGDISTAMAALSSVQTDLVDVIREVKFALQQTNAFLKDEEFKSNLKTSVENLSKLSYGVRKVIDENKDELSRLLKNSNRLVSSTDSLIQKNSGNVSSLIFESKQFFENSNAVLDSVNQFLTQVTSRKNNIGKVLYDETMLKNLKKSLHRLNELTKLLIEQLKNEGINVDANIF